MGLLDIIILILVLSWVGGFAVHVGGGSGITGGAGAEQHRSTRFQKRGLECLGQARPVSFLERTEHDQIG